MLYPLSNYWLFNAESEVVHHYETISETGSELPDPSDSTCHIYQSIPEAISGHYSKGAIEELSKCNWFYGNITEEQAEAEMSFGKTNRFLVRHTMTTLILSARINGWSRHTVINRSPQGYCLGGGDKHFKTISELIAHHRQCFSFYDGFLLGTPCDKRSSGMAAHA